MVNFFLSFNVCSDLPTYLHLQAARKGLGSAEFALGYYAEVGVGGSKDIALAKKWYAKVRVIHINNVFYIFVALIHAFSLRLHFLIPNADTPSHSLPRQYPTATPTHPTASAHSLNPPHRPSHGQSTTLSRTKISCAPARRRASARRRTAAMRRGEMGPRTRTQLWSA